MKELKKAEMAGLEALYQECKEELKNGVPMKAKLPICNKCRLREKTTCSVYPSGIPGAILRKEKDCRQFVSKD